MQLVLNLEHLYVLKREYMCLNNMKDKQKDMNKIKINNLNKYKYLSLYVNNLNLM